MSDFSEQRLNQRRRAACGRTIRTLRSNITRTIGVSHHFLLWRRKYQNSPIATPDSCLARFSKSFSFVIEILELSEITFDRIGLVGSPIAGGGPVKFSAHGIMENPHERSDRRIDEKVDGKEQHVGDNEPDRIGQVHHGAVHRPNNKRRDQADTRQNPRYGSTARQQLRAYGVSE